MKKRQEIWLWGLLGVIVLASIKKSRIGAIVEELPPGKTLCRDGTYSTLNRSAGVCSYHGGFGSRNIRGSNILQQSTYVRDVLIRPEAVNKLPKNAQNRLMNLIQEFKDMGYVDARYNLGPDQGARMTRQQKNELQKKQFRVFEIEQEIKSLLKSPEEKREQQLIEEIKKTNSRRSQLERQIKDLETIFSKQLQSTRSNAYKTAYQAAKQELSNL